MCSSDLSTLTCLPTKTEEEIVTAADHLLSLGCHAVIVTLGERGAYLASRGTSLFCRTEHVVAVDSTGAGDSFIGTNFSFFPQYKPLLVNINGCIMSQYFPKARISPFFPNKSHC